MHDMAALPSHEARTLRVCGRPVLALHVGHNLLDPGQLHSVPHLIRSLPPDGGLVHVGSVRAVDDGEPGTLAGGGVIGPVALQTCVRVSSCGGLHVKRTCHSRVRVRLKVVGAA